MNSAESIPGRVASRRGGLAAIRCSAFFFDLHGVLIDSTPAVQRVWAQWAMEHGFKPDAVVAHAHGRPSLSTVRHCLPDADHELENREIERREIEDLEGIVVLPGAVELLTCLPPHRWTIATSCTRRLAEVRLRAAGLPIPQCMVTSTDVTRGKPDPEPFLKAAAKLKLSHLRLRGLRRRSRGRSVRQSCWDAGCSPAHNISRGPVAQVPVA
jgi:beta-phosphoglucomutase-like phosphatase (HAD superfamily)